MPLIVNASPQAILLGTDDQSIRKVPVEDIELPTHLPKFYSFFEKGPTTPQVVSGGKLLKMFGASSFDVNTPYYTKTTKFINDIIGTGNPVVVERILPPSVQVGANVTIYMDIVADKVKKFKRRSDGSIVKDSTGNKVEDTDSPIDGYRIKVIAEHNNDNFSSSFGNRKPKPGYLTADNGERSTMFPVMEIRSKYLGEAYNNYGIAIEAVKQDEITPEFIEKKNALPFNIFLYEKAEDGSPKPMRDLYGTTKNKFVFKEGVIDIGTNIPLGINNALGKWSNETNQQLPLEYPVLDNVYFYKDNYELVTERIYVAEQKYIKTMMTIDDGSIVDTSNWFDFVSDDDVEANKYIVNPFNCFSSSRVFYFASAIDNSTISTLASNQGQVFMSGMLPIYLNGGTDGDMTQDTLEAGIRDKLAGYIDINDRVQDTALNPENIMYDCGYRLETKLLMVNFIALRKDTFLALSTTDGVIDDDDVEKHRAMAVVLKSRLALAPESEYFGTGVAKAIVVGGTGKISSDVSEKDYPQVYDIGIKSARMMGSPKWKKEYSFSKGGDNIIETMYDLKPKSIPQGVKPQLWNSGLIWSQPYDLKRYHFPAMQTVYDNDTSVLNNYFTAMALTIVNKVAISVWRKFTGVSELTPAELIDQVETDAKMKLKDVFAGIVTVTPKAMITNYDDARGYSWTLVFNLKSNVSKTVMISYTVATRKEDLK